MSTYSINGRKYHLVVVFKEPRLNKQFVFKTWNKFKQRWEYEVIDDFILKAVHEIDPNNLSTPDTTEH